MDSSTGKTSSDAKASPRQPALRSVLHRDREAAGASTADLDARRMTSGWRQVMATMVQRTRELFAEGRSVCDGVRGRLRWELRLTWLGGSRILDKLEAADYDVFHHRPTVGKGDLPRLLGAWSSKEG